MGTATNTPVDFHIATIKHDMESYADRIVVREFVYRIYHKTLWGNLWRLCCKSLGRNSITARSYSTELHIVFRPWLNDSLYKASLIP